MSEYANVLERMVLPQEEGNDTISGLLPDIGKQAHRVLGYHVIHQQQQTRSFLETIKEVCGHPPYTASSVADYKQKVARAHNRKYHHTAFTVLYVTCVTLGFCAFLAGLSVGITSFLSHIAGWGLPADLASNSGFSLAVGSFICLAHLVFSDERGIDIRGFWHKTSLRGYRGYVPGFALEWATRIKKEFPKTRFEVHQLVQGRTVLDPFLVAKLDGKRYYIAVWDEQNYNPEEG